MRTDKIYQRKRDFDVCGIVGVCATTKKEFVKEVFSMPTTPVSATVDLVGVPAIISAKENPKIAEMYNRSTMAAIDGMPIVKIGRRKGFSCERCAAPDIMGDVFKESVKQGKSHYFYGGKDNEVLKKLRTNLEKDYPGIQIVGMYSPPFRPMTEEEDIEIIEKINGSNPDFVWVGLGAPKQEKWMGAHQGKINGLMIGVGAGFDYYAENIKRAPMWMQKHNLEWVYRLAQDPKRLFKRYWSTNTKFIWNAMIKGR